MGSITSMLLSALLMLADLLIKWRLDRGDRVSGVGSVLGRIDAMVRKWGEVEFAGLTKEQANRERRNSVLMEAALAGINLPEKYLRWLIESALIRREAESQEEKS